MKYKIYATTSLEVLKNKRLLGEAETFQEACNILRQTTPRAASSDYWRYLCGETATFIDYGSWTQFAAIVPAVSFKELAGQE